MVDAVPLNVTILSDSQAKASPSSCTVCWATMEALQDLMQRIETRFAGQLRVEYVDLHEPDAASRFPKIALEIQESTLLLPVLAINGSPVLAGSFDYRMVAEVIDVQLEIGGH